MLLRKKRDEGRRWRRKIVREAGVEWGR